MFRQIWALLYFVRLSFSAGLQSQSLNVNMLTFSVPTQAILVGLVVLPFPEGKSFGKSKISTPLKPKVLRQVFCHETTICTLCDHINIFPLKYWMNNCQCTWWYKLLACNVFLRDLIWLVSYWITNQSI